MSWDFVSRRELDWSCLCSSVLRKGNIIFKSDTASSSLTWKWWALACLMALLTLFFACLYSSMWTTWPVFRFFLSAHHLACFAQITASSIQAEFVQKIKKGHIVQINKIINVVTRGDWARSLELWPIYAFYISAFHHLSQNSRPQEVSANHEEEVVRQVHVFNSYGFNKLSRQNRTGRCPKCDLWQAF